MTTAAMIPTSCLILLSTLAASGAPPAQQASSPSAVGTSGTTPPTDEARSATAADYRLVTGDKLRVEVYKDAQLSQSVQIRPDGKITLPLVGDVTAAGRTSVDLREAIAGSLKEYISNPVVTVIVTETVTESFYVMGEVTNPNTYPLKGQVSVVQALAMAGGFKDFANQKDISIQRRTPTGTTILPFNYKDAVKGKGKMLFLQPGDTVIVR